MLITGTCKENVTIPAQIVGVTLNGQKKATIQHSEPNAVAGAARHVIYIRGRAIVITGLTIMGGHDGIHLSGPAHAVIDDNIIIQNEGRGIHLDKSSVAQIVNNTIRENGGEGIHVTENSYARIGFLIPADEQLRPNTIQDNGGGGIVVARHSSAWIVGNTIIGNGGSGIAIDRGSDADILANTISGNRGDAIVVSHNSGANLKNEGTARLEGPNQTDPALMNDGVGVRCTIGGYVEGPLGTLNGSKGVKEFDGACIDRLITR